jgi:hypothetical protein
VSGHTRAGNFDHGSVDGLLINSVFRQ